MEKEFIKLSWKILEYKFAYYYPHLLKKEYKYLIIEDKEYDLIENNYKTLAKKLNKNPSASNMIGFNLDRPSCQLVANKIGEKI